MSDAAIATVITGLVTVTTIVIGFLTMWVKVKYGNDQTRRMAERTESVESKIDDNTRITQAGARSAVINAQAASNAAISAKEATDTLSENVNRKLNGGLDHAINSALEPIKRLLEDHDEERKDIRSIVETLKQQVAEHTEYTHRRNHDMQNSMQAQSNNIVAILEILRRN